MYGSNTVNSHSIVITFWGLYVENGLVSEVKKQKWYFLVPIADTVAQLISNILIQFIN